MSDTSVIYTVDFQKNTVIREVEKPFSFYVDFENNMIDIEGKLPYEQADGVSVKLVAPDNSIAYIGQADEYDVKVGLGELMVGNYGLYLYNDAYNEPFCQTFYVGNEFVNLNMKSAEISASDMAKAEVKLENATYNDKKFRLIIAVFDEKNRLTSVNAEDKILKSRSEEMYEIATENKGSGGNIKLMIWDENLSPVISAQWKEK